MLLSGIIFPPLHAGEQTGKIHTPPLPIQSLPKSPQTNEPSSLCKQLATFTTLYKKPESALTSFKLITTGQYQMAHVMPNGANKYKKGSNGTNDEFRRAYLGFQASFWKDKLIVKNLTNTGGLPSSKKTVNKQWKRTKTDWSFFEMYAEYSSSLAQITWGKFAPELTAEYRTSSSSMPWIERSALVNQMVSVSNWGIQLTQAEKKAPTGGNISLYLNGTGDEFSQEFATSSDDSVTLLTSYYFTTKNKSRLWIDYAHNFTHYAGKALPAQNQYDGTGARDIITLSWDKTINGYFLLAEAIAGFEVVGTNEGKNVYGLSFTTSKKIAPHWEGVSRIQLSTGSQSVKVNSRYAPSVTNYPSWVSSMISIYLGANYVLCPNSPALTRLMTGIEYTGTHSSHSNTASYSGWTLLGALRFSF